MEVCFHCGLAAKYKIPFERDFIPTNRWIPRQAGESTHGLFVADKATPVNSTCAHRLATADEARLLPLEHLQLILQHFQLRL